MVVTQDVEHFVGIGKHITVYIVGVLVREGVGGVAGFKQAVIGKAVGLGCCGI